MTNDTIEIIRKVRSMPPKERARFASHKSKAIYRKKMNEDDAVQYAWQRLGIIQWPPLPVIPTDEPVKEKRSWLSRWIREGA